MNAGTEAKKISLGGRGSTLWTHLREAVLTQDEAGIAAVRRRTRNSRLPSGIRSAVDAQLAWVDGRPDEARVNLQAKQRKRELSPAEKLVLGSLLIADGKLDEAEGLLSEVLDLEDEGADVALGMLNLARKDAAQALPHLERAMKRGDPKNLTCVLFGETLLRLSRTKEARDMFALVCCRAPSFTPAWRLYAATSQSLGKAKEAVQFIRRHAGEALELPPVRIALAHCLRASGKPRAALRTLTPVAHKSESEAFLLRYAELALVAKANNVARKTLDSLEERFGESSSIARLRGSLVEKSKSPNSGEVLSWYRRAVELDRQDLQAQLALGRFLMRDTPFQNFVKATEVFEGILRNFDKPPAIVLVNLAFLRKAQGRDGEAKALAGEVLSAIPEGAGARKTVEALAQGKIRKQDGTLYERARDAFGQKRRRSPRRPAQPS